MEACDLHNKQDSATDKEEKNIDHSLEKLGFTDCCSFKPET